MKMKGWRRWTILILICLGLLIGLAGFILRICAPNDFFKEVGLDLITVGLGVFLCQFLFKPSKKEKRKRGPKEIIILIVEYASVALILVGSGLCIADLCVPNPLYADIGTRIRTLGTLIYLAQLSITRGKKKKDDTNETCDTTDEGE